LSFLSRRKDTSRMNLSFVPLFEVKDESFFYMNLKQNV